MSGVFTHPNVLDNAVREVVRNAAEFEHVSRVLQDGLLKTFGVHIAVDTNGVHVVSNDGFVLHSTFGYASALAWVFENRKPIVKDDVE